MALAGLRVAVHSPTSLFGLHYHLHGILVCKKIGHEG